MAENKIKKPLAALHICVMDMSDIVSSLDDKKHKEIKKELNEHLLKMRDIALALESERKKNARFRALAIQKR